MTERTTIVSSWRPGLAPISVTADSTSQKSPVVSNVGVVTENPSATVPHSRTIMVL